MKLSVTSIIKGVTLALVIAIIIVLTYKFTTPEVQATSVTPESTATLMIEAASGRHGSVWRFHDNNRTCYFNSSGGIWCNN